MKEKEFGDSEADAITWVIRHFYGTCGVLCCGVTTERVIRKCKCQVWQLQFTPSFALLLASLDLFYLLLQTWVFNAASIYLFSLLLFLKFLVGRLLSSSRKWLLQRISPHFYYIIIPSFSFFLSFSLFTSSASSSSSSLPHNTDIFQR